MKVIGSPIAGVHDWSAEAALFFAEAVAPEARAFVQIRALGDELARTHQALAAFQSKQTELDAQVAALRQNLEQVTAQPRPAQQRAVWVKPTALVVGIVLFSAFTAAGLAPVGILLAVVAAAVWLWAQRAVEAETARIEGQREEVTHNGKNRWQEREGLAATISQQQGHAASLQQQIEALRPTPRLRGMARIAYPVSKITLSGYTILVDRGGSSGKVAIRLPDLAADADTLARIQAVVERAKNAPVLLRPDRTEVSAVDTLHGEEADLRQAMEDFTEMVESIPTFEEKLPLVSNTDPLSRFIAANTAELREDPAPTLVLASKTTGEENRAMQRVSDLAARLRGAGRQIDQTLRGIQRDLGGTLEAYRGYRAEAMDALHARFAEVLSRSDMAYVRYYCPKCNRVPAYLFDRLGIEIDDAHTLSPSQLLEALQRDPEVAERVTNDEQLRDKLNENWLSIQEIQTNLASWQERQARAAASRQNDVAGARALDSSIRALRSQLSQAIEQFRACLRQAVTGNPRPTLELSRQATLHLDLHAEVWTCSACEMRIEDPEIARMGRMLRIKDELLMPMWNHLWTEKDDFRKKELFRTNEQLQALIEKEAAALRDVAEQYRADMRPVRENLILASMEAMTKREQLESTVTSLEAVGVISREQRLQSSAKVDELTGGDLGILKKRAEAKENLLNIEPQAQMERRVPAIDPVRMHLTPDTLFRNQALPPSKVLALSASSEVPA